MAQYKDDMFIVINRKHIEEIRSRVENSPEMKRTCETLISHALGEINCLRDLYEQTTGKSMDQKYYVCNQDEPYANQVIKIILDGENLKETRTVID